MWLWEASFKMSQGADKYEYPSHMRPKNQTEQRTQRKNKL